MKSSYNIICSNTEVDDQSIKYIKLNQNKVNKSNIKLKKYKTINFFIRYKFFNYENYTIKTN